MIMNHGGHEVRTIDNKPINWDRPPSPTTRVLWSKRDWKGRKVIGSFRTIAHLNRLNNLAHLRGWNSGLVIIQGPYNSGVAASAGTHNLDAVVDCYIPGVGWWEMQRFLRANGLGCWYRRPPKFGNHIHGFTLPPREGKDVSDDFRTHGFKVGLYVDGGWSTYGRKVASSQISDYYDHRDGLAGHARDTSWFPADISKTIFNLNAYVSRRAGKPGPKPKPKPKPVKSVTTLAREVIDGKWGNGDTRTKRLKAAGHNPAAVQRKVNQMLANR